MFIYYGFDFLYVILILPCLLFALWASYRVNDSFKKYSKYQTSNSISGADAAKRVLATHGIRNVQVVCIDGNLTDHYDPRANVIRLSSSVYFGRTVAAIGVACHEAGHAVQYAVHYAPIRLRAAIIPITNIGSKLAMPLILLGLLLNFGAGLSYIFVYLGIGCFALSLVLQLITLPVEFNASRRAIECINEQGLLTTDEQKGAKKVLRAAAMTYVAATAVSLAQLLRLLLLTNRRNRR